DDDAPNVQTGDARCAETVEQKAAYQGADNSERDVEPETLALCVDNFASNEPGDQPKYDPADDGHVLPPFKLCLETVRHLAAALGKLCHDLLVQPDVHFCRAIESACIAEFLRQLFAGAKAAVQFQQFHQVNDRPFPIIIFVLLIGEFRKACFHFS